MNRHIEHIGTRMKNTLNAFVSADETIRPLRDHIVVEPLPWNPSAILEVEWHGEYLRGKVLAVGPGHHPKKYNGPKGKRTKSWDSKAFQPCDVQVGDIVQLGGLEIRGYLFNTLMWAGRTVILCREADVVGIESRASEAA
jgi:co-chaperonin GroES (HSP10)